MKIAELQTKIGKIVVEEAPYDKDYPGYYVSLRNESGYSIADVLFEVDETENEPVCKVHVWDETQEEPIINLSGIVKNDTFQFVKR